MNSSVIECQEVQIDHPPANIYLREFYIWHYLKFKHIWLPNFFQLLFIQSFSMDHSSSFIPSHDVGIQMRHPGEK